MSLINPTLQSPDLNRLQTLIQIANPLWIKVNKKELKYRNVDVELRKMLVLPEKTILPSILNVGTTGLSIFLGVVLLKTFYQYMGFKKSLKIESVSESPIRSRSQDRKEYDEKDNDRKVENLKTQSEDSKNENMTFLNDDLNEDNEDSEDNKNNSRQKLANLVQNLQSMNNDLKESNQELNFQIALKQEELNQLNEELNQLNEEQKNDKEQLETLKREKKQIEKEYQNLIRINGENNQTINNLKSSVNEKSEELKTAKSKYEKLIQVLRNGMTLSEDNTDNNQIEKKLTLLNQQASNSKKSEQKIQTITEDLKSTQEKLQLSEKQRQKLQDKIDQYKSNMSQIEENLQSAQDKIKETKQELTKYKQKVMKQKDDIQEFKTKNEMLETQITNLNNQIDQLTIEFHNKGFDHTRDIKSLIQNYNQTKNQGEIAIDMKNLQPEILDSSRRDDLIPIKKEILQSYISYINRLLILNENLQKNDTDLRKLKPKLEEKTLNNTVLENTNQKLTEENKNLNTKLEIITSAIHQYETRNNLGPGNIISEKSIEQQLREKQKEKGNPKVQVYI
jgi:chromosome segregation ATPase